MHLVKHSCGDTFNSPKLPTMPHTEGRTCNQSKKKKEKLSGHADQIYVLQQDFSNFLVPFDPPEPPSKLDAQEPAVREAGKESQGPLEIQGFP